MKTPKKRLVVTLLCLGALLAIIVLSTADYSSGAGIYRLSCAPLFRIDVGRSEKWIVPTGINIARDQGIGMAGNVVEVPVWPGYRVGIRIFSQRWWKEAHAK